MGNAQEDGYECDQPIMTKVFGIQRQLFGSPPKLPGSFHSCMSSLLDVFIEYILLAFRCSTSSPYTRN
jgi:hypothetical protein